MDDEKNINKQYVILSTPVCQSMAQRMVEIQPQTFTFFQSTWQKFPDSGMDNIELGGFNPVNHIRDSHVIFLASFHDNDVILSQFHALVCLLESFIESLTVVLPFYPVGTMERVLKEGVVATASTTARLCSNLPHCGKPVRFMIYDVHTLQNRFYFYGGTIASLHTTVPCILKEIGEPGEQIDAIAFPDDGAAKRFKNLFPAFKELDAFIVCGKVRLGDQRIVKIQDGDAAGKRVLIVDDMVRTGGTLVQCAKALENVGAASVSAFVAHAAFPGDSWRRFCRDGDRNAFERFYLTNSNLTVVNQLPTDDCFTVLDLVPQIIEDL